MLYECHHGVAFRERFSFANHIRPCRAHHERLQGFLERNAVLLCKSVIAYIMRIGENRACTVMAEYEIRDPNGNFLACRRVNCLHTLQFDARLFLFFPPTVFPFPLFFFFFPPPRFFFCAFFFFSQKGKKKKEPKRKRALGEKKEKVGRRTE